MAFSPNHFSLTGLSSSVIGFAVAISPLIPARAAEPANQGDAPPAVLATKTTQAESGQPNVPRFYIREYRVDGGANLLSALEVETAVYPYLGPYRTTDDVEQARAALEKAYHDKGFQTIMAEIPQQQVKGGVIHLHVVKGEVERLRVKGSRYFSISQIQQEAPSLQEGVVPNFNNVAHDLVVLNQMPDRRITPSLQAGKTPGTVDVDLDVKDTPPLHGSLEINNRYSAETTPLRINGSASYDNLWQLGHSVGGSFQVSPEDLSQVKVISGYYLAPIPQVEGLSLMLQGTEQDSDVSTLAGIGVAGRGNTVGLRAIFTLPPQKDFYHSISLGLDRKHYEQGITIAGTQTTTPITYYPLSAAYSGTWIGKGYETDVSDSVNFHFRGVGSSESGFELNRNGADGSYIYIRGEGSHTRDLPVGFQVAVKAQGQAADKPLVNNEQFSGGGLDTVRGYLESEELGDNAVLGSAELRSPSLTQLMGKSLNEWRFYTFGEGGLLTLNNPLPEQKSRFTLASIGVGTRIKFRDHFNGSVDLGVPMIKGVQTGQYETLVTFRAWADF